AEISMRRSMPVATEFLVIGFSWSVYRGKIVPRTACRRPVSQKARAGNQCEDLHAPARYPLAESGGPFRPLRPAPGLLGQVLCRLFFDPDERMEQVAIDQPLSDGEILPIAGGIEVIHTPGHCAGHVALLWHPGRMLFAGDVCTN